MNKSLATICFYKKYLFYFLLLAILLFRFYDLDLKPTHFDEGVNGHFVEKVKKQHYYDYNPENYHGPLYFYLLSIGDLAFGSKIEVHRSIAVACSFISLMVLLYFRRLWNIGWLSFLLLGFSPAITFFSRYSIHEPLLMSSLILYITSLFLFVENKVKKQSATCFALALLIMATTKETFVIHVFSSLPFLFYQYRKYWNRFKNLLDYKDLAACFFVFLFLYSNGFRDFLQVFDFFKAYLPWLHTGFDGAGHEKPFYYFLELLFTYESPFLLGFLYAFYYAFKGDDKKKLLSTYALISFAIYSLIPYKTPWCFISILWPFAILSDWAYQKVRAKALRMFYAITSILLLVFTSYHLNFINHSNPKHSYVYVQSTLEMKNITDALKEYASLNPDFYRVSIFNSISSQWPLPWLMKDFSNITYANKPRDNMQDFTIIFIDKKDEALLNLEGTLYNKISFYVRSAQEQSLLMIHKEKQKDFISFWESQ